MGGARRLSWKESLRAEVSSLIKSLDQSYAEHWEIRLYTWEEYRKEILEKMRITNFDLKKIILEQLS